MGILGTNWFVYGALESTPGVDAVEPILIAGGTELKRLAIVAGSPGIADTFNNEQIERIVPVGDGTFTSVELDAKTVEYTFGFLCPDAVTNVPPEDVFLQSSGFELVLANFNGADGGNPSETRYALTGNSVPATFYQWERFVNNDDEILLNMLNTLGSLAFSLTFTGELQATYTGRGVEDVCDYSDAADLLDADGVPLLLKDLATAVGAGLTLQDCTEIAKRVKTCGAGFTVGGLSYPIQSIDFTPNVIVTEIRNMLACGVAETCLEVGQLTGSMTVDTTDDCAATDDAKARVKLLRDGGDPSTNFVLTFTSADCEIEFIFNPMRLLPGTRNLGKPVTWTYPFESVPNCTAGQSILEIVYRPLP